MAGYDRGDTVTDRFLAHTTAKPESVAVCGLGSTASYREIDARSSRLACDLIGLGVQPGSRVALCCGRGSDAVVGLLGVLKAGAVCLPLDPTDPSARLLRLMRDAEVAFVVTTGPVTGLAPNSEEGAANGGRPTLIDVATLQSQDRGADGAPPAPDVRMPGASPALVLADQPCSVTVEHAELVHQLDLLAEAAGGLTDADTIQWWAPAGTQRSVWEMLLALCHGARLAIVDNRSQDAVRVLSEDRATVLLAVDRDLVGAADGHGLAAARAVLCLDRGPDRERMARLGRALQGRLRWAYCPAMAGPIAVTPPVTATAVGPAPALRPVRRVRVLDEDGSMAPIGVYGAVHFGLSERAMVTGAVDIVEKDGCALVRTGDIGRITVDGTLEISGPEPDRAHVADYTIDLAAVADQVMSHASVRDCVVRVRHTAVGIAELVAYVVPTRDVTEEQIVRTARPALPAALAFAAVVLVSDLPRTASGRLDEAALARFPVLDKDVAARWEQRWNALAGSGRVAVVVSAGRAPQGPPAPVRLTGSAGDTGSLVPRGAADGVREHAPPSISAGPPLRPLDVDTLDAALRRAASAGQPGESCYIGFDGTLDRQSYAELLDDASRLLGGLRGLGVAAGDKVLFQLAANRDFVVAFWACVLGGFVAIPLAVPPAGQPDGRAAAKVQHARESLGRPLTLTDRAHAASLRARGRAGTCPSPTSR